MSKLKLIRWVLLLQEFDLEIKDKKELENIIDDCQKRSSRVRREYIKSSLMNN